MTSYNVHSISAFMAIGKRYSVDIKLHGIGVSSPLVEIDAISLEGCVAQWVKSRSDIIDCVNAFFGDTFEVRVASEGCFINYSNAIMEQPILGHDFTSLCCLRYALDTIRHADKSETFSAIARYVSSVSCVSSYDWQGSESSLF